MSFHIKQWTYCETLQNVSIYPVLERSHAQARLAVACPVKFVVKKKLIKSVHSPRQIRQKISYLIFMWIVVQYTFRHEIRYHRISSQGSHVRTNNGKNFGYKTVNEATQASSLFTKKGPHISEYMCYN